MRALKEFDEIEKEIGRYSNGHPVILVVDTGGLIDISHTLRQEKLGRNGRQSNSPEGVVSFLSPGPKDYFPLITPKTYREIFDHRGTRLNSYSREITPDVSECAFGAMIRSNLFFSGLNLPSDSEERRYDAYWASKLCCGKDAKKEEEGFSLVDLDILYTLAKLSGSRVKDGFFNDFGIDEGEIGLVGVISSDSHLIKGAEFLGKYFPEKYSSVFAISTRRKSR